MPAKRSVPPCDSPQPALRSNLLLFASIFILSASLLAYEIALMRLFSAKYWYHFAYMIISMALLGFCASSTILAAFQNLSQPSLRRLLVLCATLSGISVPVALRLSELLSFEPFRVVWAWQEYAKLFANYLLLSVPFVFGGAAIGLAFRLVPSGAGAVYAANMAGSGLGSLGIIGLMFVWPVPRIIDILGLVSCAAGFIMALSLPSRRDWIKKSALIGLVGTAWIVAFGPIEIRPSQYKPEVAALHLPEAKITSQKLGPLGQIDVVASPAIRVAPGLSLSFDGTLPPQQAIFVDGDGPSAVTHVSAEDGQLDFVKHTTAAAPYQLVKPDSVLVLGAGGGMDVLEALHCSAARVVAVEQNFQVVELMREELSSFSGGLYSRDNVDVQVAEARNFMESSSEHYYDIIQLSLLEAYGAAAAGVYAANENYLYTVEAFERYLQRLSPTGFLAVTRWVKHPPRDAIKLLATAAEAIEQAGEDPLGRLALIRGWNTITMLASKQPLSELQRNNLRDFCDANSFDIDFLSGMDVTQANRFNAVEEPSFATLARQVLSPERKKLYEEYVFNVCPATDDRPYFFDFFRWRSLPQLYDAMGKRLISSDWGYLALAAALIQACVSGGVLLALPLIILRRRLHGLAAVWPVVIYFAAIGVGYIFLEVVFIQKLILFLGHPTYAVSAILTIFLAFSGLGSLCSERLAERSAWVGRACAAAVAALALLYIALLKSVTLPLMDLPVWARFFIASCLLAPLSFLMGIPFPTGLRRVLAHSPERLAVAWAANGFASVVGAVLTSMIAVSIGFRMTGLVASACYLVAAGSLSLLSPKSITAALGSR